MEDASPDPQPGVRLAPSVDDLNSRVRQLGAGYVSRLP